MRLLAVPNFSLGTLSPRMDPPARTTLHYARADADHGRAVVAISGEAPDVTNGLLALARELLPRCDLRQSSGAHPRVGALDVAPFVGEGADQAARDFAARFAREFEVPVHLYEASAHGRDLPALRRGEPGPPDFGPAEPHPRWGRTVVGARRFLIAANLDFRTERREQVRAAAREVRRRRDSGDPDLVGVRALAFDLPLRGATQGSFNLTRPDETSFDRVAEIFERLVGERALRSELVGVIRRRDLMGATRLSVAPEQIV